MGVKPSRRDPGQFAITRFRARRRAWRRRICWIVAIVGIAQIGILALLGVALQPAHLELFLGLGLGMAAAMGMVTLDSPPPHIEHWRQGAEGERATAKALRRLVRAGWALVHDIDVGRGNIDHILVGPPGVFLLESKNLRGAVSVARGVFSVRWHEDPSDGYENAQLAPRLKARAAELSAALGSEGVDRIWVQPLVVLWGAFEQRSVESDGVAWVEGRALASVLAARPTTLPPGRITAATTALERWLSSAR